VPAAFNNLIGVKPTCGWLSTAGVVPACRSLDSVSIFALTAHDAAAVLEAARGFDDTDPYSRLDQADQGPDFSVAPLAFRFGVPLATQLEFFGDREYARLFEAAVAALETQGGIKVPLDFTPFLDTAKLLYEGPWVAERYAAIEDFLRAKTGSVFPVTRQTIVAGKTATAVDIFRAQYRLKALQAQAIRAWEQVDLIVTPTAGTIYQIAELLEDPIRLSSNLRRYTNFMNLLDLAAVAVPAGFRKDGMPFGITLAGMARSDHTLLALASRFHAGQGVPLGARFPMLSSAGEAVPFPTSNRIEVAVCGAQYSWRRRTLPPATGSTHCRVGRLFARGWSRLRRAAKPSRLKCGRCLRSILAASWPGSLHPLASARCYLQRAGWCRASSASRWVLGAQDITALKGWRACLASL